MNRSSRRNGSRISRRSRGRSHRRSRGRQGVCRYDSLAVTSKMGSEEARNHGLFCGNKLPPVGDISVVFNIIIVPIIMIGGGTYS